MIQEAETFKLPLRFVWGVKAIDDGNHLIPTSKGSLHFDYSFNPSSPDAQIWMLNFCKQIKEQSFYQTNAGPTIHLSCLIENLLNFMNQR